jgi:hypothetical protein
MLVKSLQAGCDQSHAPRWKDKSEEDHCLVRLSDAGLVSEPKSRARNVISAVPFNRYSASSYGKHNDPEQPQKRKRSSRDAAASLPLRPDGCFSFGIATRRNPFLSPSAPYPFPLATSPLSIPIPCPSEFRNEYGYGIRSNDSK